MKRPAGFDDMLRSYAESGITLKDAAANLGVAYARAHYRARQLGLAFQRSGKKSVPDARALAMRDAYLSGRTLDDIGQGYGVTRERVRQIITKYFGRLAKQGGQHLTARIAREKRLAALDAEALAKWGCTRQQLAVLRRMGRRLMASGVYRDRTPTGAFCRQRQNADDRGISWELSLWDWWTIWQKSGKWSRRGRARGQFVMCRKGDTGPYSKDNVFIDLACRNVSSAVRKNDLPVGVKEAGGGKYEARTRFNNADVPTLLGRFDTPQEAHIAYLRALHREAA